MELSPDQDISVLSLPCQGFRATDTVRLTVVSPVARHPGSQDLRSSSGCVLWLHRRRSLPQEPGPAKMAVTSSSSSSSIPSAEKVPTTKSTLWQEEMRAKDQPDGSSLSPAQSPSQSQPPAASTLREPGLESKDGEWESWGPTSQLCNRRPSPQSWCWELRDRCSPVLSPGPQALSPSVSVSPRQGPGLGGPGILGRRPWPRPSSSSVPSVKEEDSTCSVSPRWVS